MKPRKQLTAEQRLSEAQRLSTAFKVIQSEFEALVADASDNWQTYIGINEAIAEAEQRIATMVGHITMTGGMLVGEWREMMKANRGSGGRGDAA